MKYKFYRLLFHRNRPKVFHRRFLRICIVIVSVFLIILLFKPNCLHKLLSFLSYQVIGITSYKKHYNKNSFTINTKGCTIPSLNPWDASIQEYVYYPNDIPRCLNKTALVLERNRTHIWVKSEVLDLEKDKINVKCCYRPFYRPSSIKDINKNVDDRVSYGDCTMFTKHIKIQDEFIKVNCSILNFINIEEYFLSVQKKKWEAHNNHKEIPKNDPRFNVLVLGIDSVSRNNFYRTMPKTVKFLLEKGAVDLAGYNKVGDNTFPNLIPLLLGISDSEIKTTCLPYSGVTFDNCPFIWEWYKQAGYSTTFVEDTSWLGSFNYLKSGFSNTPTDYYPHTFIHEAEKYASKQNGFNTSKLCLNDKYFYQVFLNYVEEITYTLNSKKLFGLFWETTMSHDYLNYPMVMDDDYTKLLRTLDSSGYLKKSIIFILSDHGIRWGGIRYTKQGRIEERLPFAFILTPPQFQQNYKLAFNNLKINSKRLTTPYDVYATLYDLINLKSIQNQKIQRRSTQMYSKNRSISLFLPIPSNRTCNLAGINDHWCTCHDASPVSKDSVVVLNAASHLVQYMNLLIYDTECANLSLSEVIVATEVLAGRAEEKETNGWREIMLVVKTNPGDGIFEATLRQTENKWDVLGSVSRLNLYGVQSFCINDNLLKLYCYCK